MPVDQAADVDRFELGLLAAPGSVVLARNVTRYSLERWGFPQGIIDDAEVVMSELVTNAVVHAASDTQIHISVALVDGAPLLAVWDCSPELPKMPAFDAYSEDGRGLWLVANYSEQHGVDVQTNVGKTVWAIMPKK